MKKTIITVSRQFGSGGRSIAKQLAEKLGVPYYDKEIIEMVGEKTGFHPDYVSQRAEHAPYANTFAYAFIGRSVSGESNDDLLWKAQCKVINELAENGPCVILGRCADYLLTDTALFILFVESFFNFGGGFAIFFDNSIGSKGFWCVNKDVKHIFSIT